MTTLQDVKIKKVIYSFTALSKEQQQHAEQRTQHSQPTTYVPLSSMLLISNLLHSMRGRTPVCMGWYQA
jgi:hypothetical protein